MKVLRVAFHNAAHIPNTVSSITEKDTENGLEVVYMPETHLLHIYSSKGTFVVPASNIRSMEVQQLSRTTNASAENKTRATKRTTKKKTSRKELV